MASEAQRLDPTHTTTLRESFIRAFRKRFAKLQRAVRELIVDQDAFGLKQNDFGLPTVKAAAAAAPFVVNTRFAFTTDKEKVQAFREWLQGQIDADILEVDAANAGAPWTATYIGSAYKQGLNRAYADINSVANATNLDFYAGTKNQFLLDAFNAPEAVSKLELLGTRSFESLKGISDQMASQLNVILADGLSHGRAPLIIAKTMTDEIANVSRVRAERIARTEIINAHAEGQLDAFERLGVEEVGVLAEWRTAGDERVCKLCSSLEGAILTIDEARGLLPRHPNCRCAWLPANVGEKTKGQQWAKSGIDKRFRESIKAEHPGLSPKDAKAASRWQGADKKISDKSAIKPIPDAVAKKQSAIAAAKEQAVKEAAEKRAALKALAEKRAAEAALKATKADVQAKYGVHKWDLIGDKLTNGGGGTILKAKGFDGGMSGAGQEFIDAFQAADTIEGQIAVIDAFIIGQAEKAAAKAAQEAAEAAAKAAAEKAAKELADKVAKVLDAGKGVGIEAKDLTPEGNLNFPALSKLMKGNQLDSTNLPDDVFLAIFDSNADPLKAIETAEEWGKHVGGIDLGKYGLSGKDLKPNGQLKTFALDDVVDANGLMDGEGLTNAQWQLIQSASAKDAIKQLELWAEQKAEDAAIEAAYQKAMQDAVDALGKYGLDKNALNANDVLTDSAINSIAAQNNLDPTELNFDDLKFGISVPDAIVEIETKAKTLKAAALTSDMKDLGLTAGDITPKGTLTTTKTVELVNKHDLGAHLTPDEVGKLFTNPLPADEAVAMIEAKAKSLASAATKAAATSPPAEDLTSILKSFGADEWDVAKSGQLNGVGLEKISKALGIDLNALDDPTQTKLYGAQALDAIKMMQGMANAKARAMSNTLENFTLKELPTKLGGSTGAKLVEVTHDDGSVAKYVMKAYSGNEDQVKNEWLANALYKQFGLRSGAPDSKMGVVNGQRVIFNPFVEGIQTLNSLDAKKAKSAAGKLQDDFILDAWLSNWDVIGLSQDNAAIDATGKVLRLDNGGALLFRAQGSPKGSAFADTVSEIDTLRNASKNPSAAKVFGELTDDNVAELIDEFEQRVKDAGGVQAFADTIAQAGFDEATRKQLAAKLSNRYADLLRQRDQIRLDKLTNAPPVGAKSVVYSTKPKADRDPTLSSLKPAELSAVKRFTGPHYGEMNRNALSNQLTMHEKNLDKALDRLPGFVGTIARGVRSTDNQHWAQWKSGKWAQVEWKAYSSTTIGKPYFGANGAKESTCYIIKSIGKQGAYVDPISANKGELEVLMRRGSKFRVTGWAESKNISASGNYGRFLVIEEVADNDDIPLAQAAPQELDAVQLWKDYNEELKSRGL